LPVIHELEFAAAPARSSSREGRDLLPDPQPRDPRQLRARHPSRASGPPYRIFQSVGGIELAGKVNFLKAGAEFATIIGTHAPGHAERIQQLDRGYGLEEVFRRRSKELLGITSGIDYNTWDPSDDPMLAKAFSAKDKTLAGKAKCKTVVQSTLQLDSGARTPLAAMIGASTPTAVARSWPRS
jgi:glycogen synthase